MSVRATRWAYTLFETAEMSPQERLVLLALCYDHTDAGGCFPSQERIALLSGYRDRKVRDILASLEYRGLITRKKVRKGGRHSHTEYTLFGIDKRRTTGKRGPVDHRHKKAGGDHRQTGAGYRGIYNTTPDHDENLIEFPSKFGGQS